MATPEEIGVTSGISLFSVTSIIASVQELLTVPTAATTSSLETSLLMADTAVLGSCWSSSSISSMVMPLMPPFSLICFAASSTPFFSVSPTIAEDPEKGPTTPILIVPSYVASDAAASSDDASVLSALSADELPSSLDPHPDTIAATMAAESKILNTFFFIVCLLFSE